MIDIIISGKHASFGVYEKSSEKDKQKAAEILKFLECEYIKDRKFMVISQGEKQKVLIARALMADPELLILDELCSGLDMRARKNLLTSVFRICNEDKARVIYVTHHFEEIVPEIDKVMMIKEGSVFMKGKKEEVMNEKIIEELFSCSLFPNPSST